MEWDGRWNLRHNVVPVLGLGSGIGHVDSPERGNVRAGHGMKVVARDACLKDVPGDGAADGSPAAAGVFDEHTHRDLRVVGVGRSP